MAANSVPSDAAKTHCISTPKGALDSRLVRWAAPNSRPDSRQAFQTPALPVPKRSSRLWAMTPRKMNSYATPTSAMLKKKLKMLNAGCSWPSSGIPNISLVYRL